MLSAELSLGSVSGQKSSNGPYNMMKAGASKLGPIWQRDRVNFQAEHTKSTNPANRSSKLVNERDSEESFQRFLKARKPFSEQQPLMQQWNQLASRLSEIIRLPPKRDSVLI